MENISANKLKKGLSKLRKILIVKLEQYGN